MTKTPHLDTQVKVANATGLAQATIARILGGKVSATIDNLAAIAAAFGRDVGDLIGGGSDGLMYDRERVARLPTGEREKITSYIHFILASWETSQRGLNFETEVAASVARQQSIQQSATRAPHPSRTLTHDEETAGGGRQQRRSARFKAS